MNVVAGVVFLVFAAVLVLGWIVPLIIGIIRIRRNAAGVALTVIGASWGIFAISICCLAFYGYRQVANYDEVENFNSAQYKGETGSLVVPHKGESSLVVMDRKSSKQIRLSATDGTLIVPAGTYDLISYEAVDTDGSGTRWKASGYLFGMKSRKVSVESGSSQQIDIGHPFSAKITTKTKGQDEASFDMKLIGRDGCQYTIRRVGKSRKAPTFHVLNKSGGVLWQGSFKYG